MAFHLYEDTWETSTTTGTGAYTLAGAVAGWRTFASQYSNADTCLYAAFDGTNFEMGIGTYNAGTLARTTIYRSTNANAAVSWAAGTRNVMVTPLGVSMEALLTPGTTGYPRKTADNAWAFDATGQIPGIAGSALASAGNVGELITGNVAAASAVALTSGIAANISSISLTAGDWDVWGNFWTKPGGTTPTRFLQAAITATSATIPSDTAVATSLTQIWMPQTDGAGNSTVGGGLNVPIAPVSLQLASTTTIFLVAAVTFTVSTMGGYGTLRARRMR